MSTIAQHDYLTPLNVLWTRYKGAISLHNTQYIVPQMSGTLMVSINLHHKVQKNTVILQ